MLPAEDLVERIPVETSESLISARVNLLFEEKKRNDEDIEVLAPPRSEARDSVLQQLSSEPGRQARLSQLRNA